MACPMRANFPDSKVGCPDYRRAAPGMKTARKLDQALGSERDRMVALPHLADPWPSQSFVLLPRGSWIANEAMTGQRMG